MGTLLTLEKVKSLLPKDSKKIVTQGMIDTLNAISEDDDGQFSETYRDNFVSYMSVLKSGDYKIEDYISAVKYVSYKLMNYPNIDCYMLTFPDRYDKLLEKFRDFGDEQFIRDEKISPYVTAYNRNKLVNQILEQTMIPTHVLNASYYQEAIAVQVKLMLTAKSETVRTMAANSVITATKPPESLKVQLEVGVKETDTLAELRRVTHELAIAEQNRISSGMATAKEIAHSRIITDAEVIDD